MPLIFTHRLDPHAPDRSPYAAAAIPIDQFRPRRDELPPEGAPILVTPGPLQSLAIAALTELGLTAAADPDTQPPPAQPGHRYAVWRPNPALPEVTLPARVLDIGCGSGRDAVTLADRGAHVTAVDHLPEAIARAQRRHATYAPDAPIDWFLADITALRLDQTFDLILMLRSYDARFLPTVFAHLAPGGTVLIECLDHVRSPLKRFDPAHLAPFADFGPVPQTLAAPPGIRRLQLRHLSFFPENPDDDATPPE
ncbi:MAG: class I SAM-dependent methyltransferase [Fimbriimonadaceae bacterium]|nr:class I SAM-dependent methyltransferase [Fimbriimonadaceae bacterium]